MFALIKTNGATHIAINIPLEGSDKSLPALLAMLENNAVFVHSSWNDNKVVIPEMSVQLKQEITIQGSNTNDLAITVANNSQVLDDSFVIDKPEVRISFQKQIKNRDNRIEQLELEIRTLKRTIEDMRLLAESENH